MRYNKDSNSTHDNRLIPIMLSYPKETKGHAFVYSLKVSSRVIEDYLKKGILEQTAFSINEDNYSSMEEGFHNVFREIETLFFILKNAKQKIYSGILEVTNYKDYKAENNLTEYAKKLKGYLTSHYVQSTLDIHHGRYYESLYYVYLVIKNKTIFSVDLDSVEFNGNYNIVEAKEYQKNYTHHPKSYTNSTGYSLVEEALSTSNAQTNVFWNKLIQTEEHFEKIIKRKLNPINRKDYEKLLTRM